MKNRYKLKPDDLTYFLITLYKSYQNANTLESKIWIEIFVGMKKKKRYKW